MKIERKLIYVNSLVLVAGFSLLFVAQSVNAAKKNKKKGGFVMTEAELQSRVMGFADRFASIITQAFEDYDAKKPNPQNRRIVLGDVAYSMASAFTIAAEADPDAALLDMIVMVSLGRIVYEESYQKMWGGQIHPIFIGFRTAEVDTLSQTTLDRVMAKVAIEREAAITQAVREISTEQQKVIQGFIAEEARVRGVLSDLQQTLTSGNDLLVTTKLLLEKFEVDTPSEEPARPFDIREYRDTVAEVSSTA